MEKPWVLRFKKVAHASHIKNIHKRFWAKAQYSWDSTSTWSRVSSIFIVFLFKKFYIQGIIQYEIFCDLLLSLSIMISIYIHIVSYISTYFYFNFWVVVHYTTTCLPFISCWIPGLFSVFGYYEWKCDEHFTTGLCVHSFIWGYISLTELLDFMCMFDLVKNYPTVF